MATTTKIALIGNPNCGKSSLFNHLTGLNQKIGNFPGVTVDKKMGQCILVEPVNAEIIDLPGTYSLYPKSQDEKVVLDLLLQKNESNYPDAIVVVVDASNLNRNLLLFTQLKELEIPLILALNMLDIAENHGIKINIELLKKELCVPIIGINARSGAGTDRLKAAMLNTTSKSTSVAYFEKLPLQHDVVNKIKSEFKLNNDYQALLYAHHFASLSFLTADEKSKIENWVVETNFNSLSFQAKETVGRYEIINQQLKNAVVNNQNIKIKDRFSSKIDKILTHSFGGYVIFFALLFIIFQAVFAWASVPMEWIDLGVSKLNSFIVSILPASPLVDLLTQGLISGLGGILIFIPQIAILFAFISLLEESGYMARVMFIMDKLMRKFGLNGKSVVPLISGVACAVPAIMATRNIDNLKERLITLFVTPLMSCSARIPVFTVLIALLVPSKPILGIFNLQGMALMSLYFLGFLAAIGSAKVLQLILKSKEKSYFIMELPDYKIPRWKNVGYTILEKVKAFVLEAGKIIIAISVILWVLASYGPSNAVEKAIEKAKTQAISTHLNTAETENLIAAYKLEASYAGHFGKFIEPSIKPLGFDWKIGIALITSFAAREVFIGTMSTIYSIGADNEDEKTIIQRMRAEKNPETNAITYTPALAASLIIFYLFAMQCMSTLAVVYRETKSWKWPVIQFVYMTGLAYVSSFLVYNLLK